MVTIKTDGCQVHFLKKRARFRPASFDPASLAATFGIDIDTK